MTHLRQSSPVKLPERPDCRRPACRYGLPASPGSSLTDLSRQHLPPQLQALNFLPSGRLTEALLLSNGRSRKIVKLRALSSVSAMVARGGLPPRCPVCPRLSRTALRPQPFQMAAQIRPSSGKTPSWLPRTRAPRRTSQLSFCKPMGVRKAPKCLSADLSGSARQLFFSPNPFSPADLSVLHAHFNPSAFYALVDAEYPNRPHTEITQKSRALVLNWILLIHRKFGFRFQTFFTAVGILDSFLSLHALPAAQLQLLGLTVLFAAVKFEEVRPPKLAKFLAIAENQFSAADVIAMEGTVLSTIGFRVSTETPGHLLELVAALDRLPKAVTDTAFGLLAASGFDLRMNAFGGTLIVAASVALAKQVVAGANAAGRQPSRLSELLGPASQQTPVPPSSESTCMRYLSLIVLNLERAGMLAIRKAFPAFLAIDSSDEEQLIKA